MKTHPFALPSPAVRRLRRATLAREKALKEALEDQKKCPHAYHTQGRHESTSTNGYGSTRTISLPRMTCLRCGLREVAWSRFDSEHFGESIHLSLVGEADSVGPTINRRDR